MSDKYEVIVDEYPCCPRGTILHSCAVDGDRNVIGSFTNYAGSYSVSVKLEHVRRVKAETSDQEIKVDPVKTLRGRVETLRTALEAALETLKEHGPELSSAASKALDAARPGLSKVQRLRRAQEAVSDVRGLASILKAKSPAKEDPASHTGSLVSHQQDTYAKNRQRIQVGDKFSASYNVGQLSEYPLVDNVREITLGVLVTDTGHRYFLDRLDIRAIERDGKVLE